MKKRRNNSDFGSTLQIALSTGLLSIFAVLLAVAAPGKRTEASRHDLSGFQLKDGADALGNYPNTSVPLSGDTTVTPDAPPASTTRINVSANTNFNGTFAASPTTGVVTVTDAHPAGSYTVTVTAFGPGGTTTKTFTLTVISTPCGAGLIPGFTNAGDVGVGSNPLSVAVGDFNGDGKQDLAVANFYPFRASVRLGDGLGGFSGSTEVNGDNPIYSVAIGDFNGDGKQDLALVQYHTSGKVLIRLGDGLGGFSGSTEVPVGTYPISVAIGDFNGDGKQDLAVANVSSNTVSIRLGDGLGGFSGSTEVSGGYVPYSVAIGDFNGDGKQDLAIVNDGSDRVAIHLGDGLGGFGGSTDVSVGTYPVFVAIGDFNGDGKQDLAVANYGSNTVSIRLGDGLGGFSGSTEVSVGNTPYSVAIGDFNGDGKQDLAATNYNSTDTISIRLGDGLGNFTDAADVNVGYQPRSVAIGDFNGNGRQDLAVVNSGSGTVSIRLGQCIIPPTPTPTPSCAPVITQSTSQAITTGPVPCMYAHPPPGQGNQTENSYWRAFNMSSFVAGAQYNVSSVSFGVLSANNVQPVTVRLYRNTGGAFPGGTRIQIGSTTINVTPEQSGTVVTTPLVATVPAGTSELVMELYSPGGSLGNYAFSAGANSEPQTGLSYWSSPCSNITPINAHLVFNVYGSCSGGTPTPTPTPTATPTPPPTPTPTPTPTPSPGICGTLLYDQTSSGGTSATVSQNFETANNGFDTQLADDFVVPAGPGWTVQRVNVNGVYFNGPGPAASVNVTFYFNSGTLPGAAVPGGTYTNLPMADTAGNFSIPLPTNLVLSPGSYWVSVQANLDFTPGGEWGWLDRTVQSNSPAAWQNPGGGFGFGCMTWGARAATCGVDPTAPDQIFQIVGCLGAPTPTPTPTSTATPLRSPTPTPLPCGTFTFSNTTTINIPDSGAAAPYPSNIFIASAGVIQKVTVRLNNLSHTSPADIDVLLVGPGGQNAIIMSDVGGGAAVTGVTLTLDDDAPNSLPGTMLTTGTFKPTNIGAGDTWPAPAPTPSGGSALSAFLGTVTAGTWSLYVVDDTGANLGSIGGWELTVTTNAEFCVTISGTIPYCSNPALNPVPGVTMTLTGPSSQVTTTDANGNYSFRSAPGGSYTLTPTKAARTPGSSNINTVDVIAVQRHFLNLGTPLSGCRLAAANVNGDSTVNTVDVLAIQRFFLGLSTGIANVGKYQFTPVSRSYSPLNGNQTGQNYDALVFGDVASPFAEP